MRNQKISVIMSVYNGMPYLKDSVRSILNQTYTNFEFIIVNDDSTDDSLSFLKNLQDSRISIITNKNNIGLAASLNLALKQASGDFIARMDADDISETERLEHQVNFLTKNKRVVLCGTWASKIDKNGKKIGSIHYPTSTGEIKKKIISFNPIIHPSLMARRLFFDKLKGYREEFDKAEDYEILARGINTFKYANLPKELFRLRLSQVRRSVKSMRKMDKLDLKIKLNFLRQNGPSAANLFAIFKKLLLIYVVPIQIKIKIATLLKQA